MADRPNYEPSLQTPAQQEPEAARVDTPKAIREDNPTAPPNEAIRAPEPEPCQSCGGSGQVVVGEHHVTQDMAIDAGDRSMEGAHHSFEWGECEDCQGSGLAPEQPPASPVPDFRPWQPIETAPKDEDVLLYQRGEGVRAGYWDDEHGWLAVETQGLTGGKIQPTHWMPLPDPPLAALAPPASPKLPDLKYTAHAHIRCEVCGGNIPQGALCYRDTAPDTFRHLEHGPS